jgi:hypothetical protein
MTDTLSVEQLLNLLPEGHAWTLTSAARAELPDGHTLRVEGTRVRHYSALSTALGLYEYRRARRLLETSASDPAGEYVDRPAVWVQLVDGRDGPTADTLQELIDGVSR